MALAFQIMYSEQEYLRLENDALEKSEYFQGKIVMMAGVRNSDYTATSKLCRNTLPSIPCTLRPKFTAGLPITSGF